MPAEQSNTMELTSDAETTEVFTDLAPISSTPVAPAHGIAAMALSFALKFHGITTVTDGAMYQQFKLEGKNMTPLHLSDVFETAIQIERHLLAGSERVAAMVVDALVDSSLDSEPDGDPDAAPNQDP